MDHAHRRKQERVWHTSNIIWELACAQNACTARQPAGYEGKNKSTPLCKARKPTLALGSPWRPPPGRAPQHITGHASRPVGSANQTRMHAGAVKRRRWCPAACGLMLHLFQVAWCSEGLQFSQTGGKQACVGEAAAL
jgi:hypothetical protein